MTVQLPLPIADDTGIATPVQGSASLSTVTLVDRAAAEAIRALARLAVVVPRDEEREVWAISSSVGALAQRIADREDRVPVNGAVAAGRLEV
ncbi:hypothetical protein [Azospirillum argentinense]|uniref:Uncharacterized protein n=1 Tax=Azospirillum brasilense TaxID=192 RepID=A0A4D8QEN1_AZOBR|nr:hypothetical protein [Azospirillum argentinense]QCO07323.1 hypothetical protein D3867_36190 [Azospirillum argentinense]